MIERGQKHAMAHPAVLRLAKIAGLGTGVSEEVSEPDEAVAAAVTELQSAPISPPTEGARPALHPNPAPAAAAEGRT